MTNEELQIIISAQISDLQKKLDKAEKETKDFEKKGSKALEAFNKTMKGVGKATAAAMKVTAGAIAAGAAALGTLAESTAESRAATAKLNTAFEAAGSTAEQATETYNGLYRVLGDGGQATEAASHLAKLTTNQEHLAEWTKACQGVYATFGDSLPIESLTEAANETAKTGEITGALADALNWAGVSEDAFAEQLFWCNTEAEREALIRSTLTDLYGEAAEGYEENAASILAANEAQAALTASLDALGAAAEPLVTLFKSTLAGALDKVLPHVELITGGLQDMLNGVDGGEDKVAQGIGGLVTGLIGMIETALPSILTIGIQIITTLINGIVSALPSVISMIIEVLPQIVAALITIIPQLTGALLGSLPMILEALLLMITQIITGLTEMLPTIIAQIMTIVPQLITSLIESIPLLLEAAIQLLMAIVQAIPEILPPLIEALPSIIDSILTVVLESIPLLIEAAIELLMAIVDAIPQILPPLVSALPQIIDSIITTLLDNLPEILDAGIELLFALIDAIPQILTPLMEALPDIISTITRTLLNNLPLIISCAVELFMGIVKAVPKITTELLSAIGTLLSKALGSITESFVDVGSAIGESLSGGIKGAISWIIEKAVGFINKFINGINWAIDVINKIPGVEISKIDTLDVPEFARGGVVDSATLGVFGEAGAEAVVPLENNLEWLDKLANMLTEKMGGIGGAPIILTVDKKVLAETAKDGINQITRTTGKFPLVIA